MRAAPLGRPKQFRSEDEFRQHVTRFAKSCGYRVNFTYRSKAKDGSWRTNATAPGFLDLCCAKPGRLVFLELKMPGNVATEDQLWWCATLQTIPGVDAYVVWPSDWDDVVDLLTRPPEAIEDDDLVDEVLGTWDPTEGDPST